MNILSISVIDEFIRDIPYIQIIGILLIAVLSFVLYIFIDHLMKKHEKGRSEDGDDSTKDSETETVSDKANRKLNNKIKELNKDLSSKDAEIKELKEKLSSKDAMIDELNKKIFSLEETIRTYEKSKDKGDQKEHSNSSQQTMSPKGPAQVLETSNSLSGYSELTVLNGRLVKAESEHTVYYRSWRKKNKMFFEFVNNDRTRKAINNRTIIIEPFCIKQDDSKSPDLSEEIETKVPGILNEDYSIFKKAEIIYK